MRDSAAGVSYLQSDHLGIASVSTNASGVLTSWQRFDPWGKVRASSSTMPTKRTFTGQYLDDTGLLFYNARYYDPGIGRFVSADSIVPGNASGGMAGIASKPLTVDFHENGFVAAVNRENQFGPWFTLSDDAKQQVGAPWGPANPQALNRYSSVLNNPMRWTDPSGHALYLNQDNAQKFLAVLEAAIDVLVAQRNGWDTKAANAIFSLAMTALGGLVGSAASILMSAGIGITSSFYLDLSQVDMNGNLEALTTLRGLRGVVQSFINDGASTDILTIWVSMKTQKEDTGGTINGEPIMETVTRFYIKASWGGLLRYNHEVSGPLYKKLASTTRASDNPDKQGPK